MNSLIKNIVSATIGGVLLLLSTIILNVFFSSPPTRAEFDVLKTENILHYKFISAKLKSLSEGQQIILKRLNGRK